MPQDDKQLLKIKDAALIMEVHPRTIKRWIAEGLPVIRRNRTVRISRETLLKEKGKATCSSEPK